MAAGFDQMPTAVDNDIEESRRAESEMLLALEMVGVTTTTKENGFDCGKPQAMAEFDDPITADEFQTLWTKSVTLMELATSCVSSEKEKEEEEGEENGTVDEDQVDNTGNPPPPSREGG